ncbi:hypothetical protein FOMPIDRAFT_1100680, partial [Fomitopsis schrenkii]
RYLSGCGLGIYSLSGEGTLWATDSFLDPTCEPDSYTGDVAPRTIIAQAHSCAAHAYQMKALASADELAALCSEERVFARPITSRMGIGQTPLTYFLLAVHHACESVKLGLVSLAVLAIGTKIRQMGESLGADVERAAVEGKRFRPLWQAVARYYEEIYAKHRKAEDDPDEPVCAADGCLVRGGKSVVLRACGGRCPSSLKPSYCSRECQRKDWARHKAICK